ncbi:MAG: phosphoribosylformylglycinamidine synthase subunit PurS [Candidatus Puniceispirillales bacterium]
MQVTVTISLKPGVLDPQGRAIEHSLQSLGWQGVDQVSTGKQIILNIDEEDEARATQIVARMCETLLVNTVIEDYSIHCSTPESDG